MSDLQAHQGNAGQCYLFSYFVGNGEDGLHLSYSEDGYTWHALNGGHSYLAPTIGTEKLMRDPSILRGPDGTFHMVWTASWDDTLIGYASSTDLIHWSAQRGLPVMAETPGVRNCWAPELAYDEKRGEFLILWASTIKDRFAHTLGQAGTYNHRMYATTTRDFITFAPPHVFFDPGHIVIDATLFAANVRHYMVYKDETETPEAQKNLRLASSDDVRGPYADISAPFSPPYWVEGPSVLQVGDHYMLYFDAYTRHHYGALRSRDLETWEDVTDKVSFPRGTRHGTAFTAPRGVLETLLCH